MTAGLFQPKTMGMRYFALVLVAAMCVACDEADPVAPEVPPAQTGASIQMEWQVDSECPTTIGVKLWTPDRPACAAGGCENWAIRRYELGARNTMHAPFECWAGERVCFGAWNGEGKAWGAGDTDTVSAEWCHPCAAGEPAELVRIACQ